MARSRATLKVLTVLIVLGAVGWGTWMRLRPPPEEEAGEEGSEPATAADTVVQSVRQQFSTELPVPVTGAAAVNDTLRISVTAKGRAEAIRQARLKARKSGIVSRVGVRENQVVRAGDLLVQIDTTEYAMDLAAKTAALRTAQAEYQVRVLGGEEIADPRVREARDSLARAFTGLDQAEADHRRAVMNLERTAVRAPFGGRVADVKLVAGQYVGEGEEAVTVIDMNPMKVSVQVLGTEVVHLDEGHAAQVEFTALPGRPFAGKIETINPLVDPETNTARVTVHVSNADARIFPGMYAEADLEARKFPDRLLVPRTAILEATDGRPYLFVVDDGRASWHYVHPGMENDRLVELLRVGPSTDWVSPGETVLVDGHHYLTHDAAVRVVEDLAAAGGRPTR